MEFYAEEGKNLSSDNSTFVLPALSVGNVGQLAVDLLVASLRAERIGYLDDPNVVPCIGNDAYWSSPSGELALPLEVYESSRNALALVQQRSPVVKGMMVEFARNLANFVAANGKKHVIVLSSLEFGRWQNVDMSSGSQIHYLSSSNSDGTDDHCERQGWKRLPEYNPTQRMWKHLDDLAINTASEVEELPFEELGDEDYYASLPYAALFSCFKGLSETAFLPHKGRGKVSVHPTLPRPHFVGLHWAKGLKVTCLLCYCSEGDNIPDAFHLADTASKALGLIPNSSQGNEGGSWTVPFSWKSVYGPPPDMSLF
ncbi:hypothetical protein RND71_041756 [Anisodus tanguticus]|uniref:Proteasome assembly chaperone 2 n=1 Tax=Anisodus tanguticus TaxID=243964 RepID=A0AAE1QW11_9SOLA|nr:hypothetical protein RND71_041756 [Anisodus tanguticus]